jgi:predicted AlkP superfamily pyrophosphatase or phosphodiesterase
VASDHGFAATDTEINLFRPFIDAGLITLDADGKVKAWEAMPWPSSGSAAIVLARPDDKALEARVKALLDTLKANPEARIGAVADRAEIARMDGNPQASFYVNFGPGALAGGFKGAKAPLVSPSKYKGTHGYFPAAPEMRSTFMMMGKGVPKARNLGELDMRQIAPTLARLLKVKLSKTEARPVL